MQDQKIRISFLDGIRGASALFVVLFHAMLFTKSGFHFSDNLFLNVLQKINSIGHISVSIFIVLSGFCLAIPVVNNDLLLKKGFIVYIKRRSNRIIFPYYMALLFSIILYYIFPILQEPANTVWDSKIPLTAPSVIAHVFLVHNWNVDWIYKINGAHWSVATEWQIYFVFPVLLFFWRKFNLITAIFFSLILTIILYKLVPFAEPQFILLFFMGVISAYFTFSNSFEINEVQLLPCCLLLFIPMCLAVYYKFPAKAIYQVFFGLNFAFLLYLLTKIQLNGLSNKLINVLSGKCLGFLGKISYSLYLIHGPILALFNLYLMKYFIISYNNTLMIMCFLVVPFCVLISYGFYYLIERKFQNN
ncbi:acyltransferase family protein [Flavobacterium agrisoli]|uniref:Acyltransferase n=1 Tax=Flavobacterium agrisoli TaxID=2793066 RepID=A0A934PQL7_9FLAO|nr:acyltransferase [Flavobacterium agrisoli]MBK0371285.1 acyltransferase [Flavobacterium agrisoli]